MFKNKLWAEVMNSRKNLCKLIYLHTYVSICIDMYTYVYKTKSIHVYVY